MNTARVKLCMQRSKKEIQEQLAHRGLSTEGLKSVLAERLAQALDDEYSKVWRAIADG